MVDCEPDRGTGHTRKGKDENLGTKDHQVDLEVAPVMAVVSSNWHSHHMTPSVVPASHAQGRHLSS